MTISLFCPLSRQQYGYLRIQENCFSNLDAPVTVVGAENVPAIPLNSILEERYLPNAEKVTEAIENLLLF